jgi:N utilization substance protein A
MANINIPRTEFAAALAQVASERGIDPDQVLESIKAAILMAYKKDFGFKEGFEYSVEVDSGTGESRVFAWPEGEESKKEEITPAGFGRIAAQQARNIIVQKIREAEKSSLLDEYEKRVGTLVSGMVLRFDGDNIVVDIGKGEAIMPTSEQNRGETYRLNMRMVFYLEGIRETVRGKQIIVSRAHEGLVEGLFKREVPEVTSGAVEIRAVAREAGSRTKIAVYSTQSGVDPVGSCVGQKGVRVQAVINELNGEKIDIIQYSEDPAKFILAALSPAENLEIEIDEDKKTALVTAPEDQLSLAIGKGGQNVRLAIKLTGYKIDIKGKTSSETSTTEAEEKTEAETPEEK